MQLLFTTLFFASSLQSLVSAENVECTKSFGQYVGQQAYDCCYYLGGKPKIGYYGCSAGQCRSVTCNLPQVNSTMWDCYSGPEGSYSKCAGTVSEIMKRCTNDQIEDGVQCPFTNRTSHL